MRVLPLKDRDDVARCAAAFVASRINAHEAVQGAQPYVLGLPTGGTPEKMYQYLVEMVKDGRLSFKNVVTFNMDEYWRLPRDHPESYWSYMHRHLFDHIDIPRENINILDGNADSDLEECKRYEEKMAQYGGVDLWIGGVGQDGHIAFNEPGSALHGRTRKVMLTHDTKIANSRFFGGDPAKVPDYALTVGVGTVCDAKEILVLATGRAKALAVYAAVEGPVSSMWTISWLQQHPSFTLLVDDEAVEELKVKTVRYFDGTEQQNMKELRSLAPARH